MKTFKEYMMNLDEAKVDLSKYADKLAKLTEKNQHDEARLLVAKLIGDKKLIELVKAVNNIINYEGYNPISQYTSKVYDLLNVYGQEKFGEDWDKYIYSNM